MSRGVVYFSHGTGHLARLVVSLCTLRLHYTGPVTVLATDQDFDLVSSVLTDPRLGCDVEKITLAKVSRNACYVTKTHLFEWTPYETTAYLDADTVVVGSVNPLLEMAEELGESGAPVLTQFSDWSTFKPLISKRIAPWSEVLCPQLDPAAAVQKSKSQVFPAINTGVFAWHKNCRPFMETWKALARAGHRLFICDEIAMQLLAQSHPTVVSAILIDRWNCSPLYGTPEGKNDPVIWHFHGDKHVRPESLPIWWPYYETCVEQEIADMGRWLPSGDKRLLQYLSLDK